MTFDTTTIVVVVAAMLAVIALLLVARNSRRGQARSARRPEGESPYVASRDRPYLKPRDADGAQGNGLADELATAATDVAGDVLGIGAKRELPGSGDDLTTLKGVGSKFAAGLNALGVTRFEQLAGLNANEAAHLDERLGAFRGRLARDRVLDQAAYLARGDIEGFEGKFGKL